ncbi:MAG: hypothetical protein HYW79_01260 [Parcubacteria group bacterium]|nr:hypothetical protein [Parcubacteria group bacterium]
MKCLVLAFENVQDLPSNWKDCESVDIYGFIKSENAVTAVRDLFADSNTKFNINNELFLIRTLREVGQPYDFCFIRHPDPWGEPRNWMKAVSALGETLSGKLECEFWFSHEIIALNYLMVELLGKSNVEFIDSVQLPDVENKKNFKALWVINHSGIQEKMLQVYEQNKIRILERFYRYLGQFHRGDMNLEVVKNMIRR